MRMSSPLCFDVLRWQWFVMQVDPGLAAETALTEHKGLSLSSLTPGALVRRDALSSPTLLCCGVFCVISVNIITNHTNRLEI